jgi:hypothetical protein
MEFLELPNHIQEAVQKRFTLRYIGIVDKTNFIMRAGKSTTPKYYHEFYSDNKIEWDNTGKVALAIKNFINNYFNQNIDISIRDEKSFVLSSYIMITGRRLHFFSSFKHTVAMVFHMVCKLESTGLYT